MSIEFKRHIGMDATFEPQSSPAAKTLPLVCPNCQNAISLSMGLCGNRLIQAILLQSQRIGTELECGSCGLRFVFHRSMTQTPLRSIRNRQEALGSVG